MALNKKQKKQLDLDRKKLTQLKQNLAGSRRQMDDPEEVRKLEAEIATIEKRIEDLLKS